jgi:hypothetical protein
LWPVGGLLLIALYVGTVAYHAMPVQGDFRIYLDAARAAMAGLDPYRLEDLSRAAGRPIDIGFVYPPAVLPPFIALSALPEATPFALWMALKLLCLVGLVMLWRRLVPRTVPVFALALVAAFGFNATALWDLRMGNIALIESTLIWAGLACYVAGRLFWFAALVTAAAVFKLAPIALLVLLLVPGGNAKPRPRLFIAAVAAFIAIVWGPLLVPPASRWHVLLGVLQGDAPTGEANPSAFALMLALARDFVPEPRAIAIALAGWITLGALLVGGSARFLRATWRSGNRTAIAMAAVSLFVILHPRPMAYGFIPLLPAPLYFAPRPLTGRAGALALAGLLCVQGISSALRSPASGTVLAHAPALLAILLWALVVVRSEAGAGAPRP